MMVENKLLAQEFVRRRDHKNRIRRIVGVNHVKTVFERDIEAHRIAAGGEISVFAYIPHERLRSQPEFLQQAGFGDGDFLKEDQLGHAIDLDAVDHLGPRLSGDPQRHHDHLIARRDEDLAFIPDARIAREVVLNEHQDSTGRLLHSGRVC